jgi:antibiotic biosynthesis monooxygenase (ABM) superfamily enzyme
MSVNFKGVDGSVTVVITRKAYSGKEKEMEEIMRGIRDAAGKFEGHLEGKVHLPEESGSKDHVVIFRFDTEDNLRKWNESEERKHWYEKLNGLVAEEKVHTFSGLESLFPCNCPHLPPPRWKMALLLIVVLYPLVNVLSQAYGLLLGEAHILLKTFCSIVTSVILTTYFIMPFVTRIFSGWLFKNR